MSVPDKLVARARQILKGSGILFLDYDGTLVPIRLDPEECYPDENLLKLLDNLHSRFEIYIVTGRSLEDMSEFLGGRYNLIALHGAVKVVNGDVVNLLPELNLYREICNKIYNNKALFEKQLDGLRMYNKNGNLLFHLGLVRDDSVLDKIRKAVERLASENQMEVYEGKNILELRPPGMDKGRAISIIRDGREAIIAGDDSTDEDSFRENPETLRIKVGEGDSVADYRLSGYEEMRAFLGKL